MCGIAGVLSPDGAAARSIEAMARTLRHRGPDDLGLWTDPSGLASLGHARLSILELTPLGHQPMGSSDGRWWVSFNGEIYNFLELRRELEAAGRRFRGRSDTEVLVELLSRRGVSEAARRLDGMFAFAAWDREERSLHLVRDRFGEKPLYYGWLGGEFLFGSELKALRAHPRFRGELDPEAVALYLRFNYVPAPLSIYRGVRKLEPGTILTVTADPAAPLGPRPYWSALEAIERGLRSPFQGSDGEAQDSLEELLRDSIRLRMVADVPLGVFLSGGIDSSLVAALMQAQSATPVKTFTVGFNERDFDEAGHARSVAAHLRTEHTEHRLTPAEAMAVIPGLPGCYDEPFADSSQIPTLCVARMTRRRVTVSLSGDGGDELFGGYNRYFYGPAVWSKSRRLPPGLRRLAARLLRAPGPRSRERLESLLGPLLRGYGSLGSFGDKFLKIAEVLDMAEPAELHERLMTQWERPGDVMAAEPPERAARWDPAPGPPAAGLAQQMMRRDAVDYLPNDILVKLDRATMSVGLEARLPFLDHRIFEFAWSLPPRLKIDRGRGKLILRRLLARRLPQSLIDQPKRGFGLPLGDWLRGPLRPWAEELLSQSRLREGGVLRAEPVRRAWLDHLSGKRDRQFHLWTVLMLQAWLDDSRARRS